VTLFIIGLMLGTLCGMLLMGVLSAGKRSEAAIEKVR